MLLLLLPEEEYTEKFQSYFVNTQKKNVSEDFFWKESIT